MTNIFCKNQLVTPKIIDSGINGIMRQVVIENAKNFFDKLLLRMFQLMKLAVLIKCF